MTIADKLLQINQVKQDIKTAIETKGVPMTNVAFTEYANKILDISGVVDEYFYYALAYYTSTNNSTLFKNAWQDMKNSETVLFDIPLELVASDFDMGWSFNFDMYVGTDGQLQALYDACADETIPPPIVDDSDPYETYTFYDVYYVNNVATTYAGDVSGDFGYPIPIYCFGDLLYGDLSNLFFIADLTPLEMGLGLALAKITTVPIPNNNIVIQQGVKFGEIGNGIIIPDSVMSIGVAAFMLWYLNNQPLVIPNSVTSIGESAFRFWYSNTQPLVVPDSVTSIGDMAFYGWPLVPYVEMQAIVPPSIASIGAFGYQNNAPIYVPDVSVDDYKSATNWVDLASRIFPISDKTAELPLPKEEQTKTVTDPNFSSGNVIVTPDAGKVLTQVTVVKDNDLVPENIVKDINIFGVVGTVETVVELTQAQYDALSVYDNNTYYLIVEV